MASSGFYCMASSGFPLYGKQWLSTAGCEQFVTPLEDLPSGLFVTLLLWVKRGDLFQVTSMVSIGFQLLAKAVIGKEGSML